MAKPDTDDGWLKYAHELDAALACADWSKGARIVLHEVFAQIYGPAKRKVAQLSPSELGRRYGTEKSNIVRSTRELVSGGALIKVSLGWYRFNKNYEAWTRNGHPRLSPGEKKWAKDAPRIAMAYKHISGDKSDTKTETSLTPAETSLTPPTVSDLSPNGDKSDTKTETSLTPPPYKGSAGVSFKNFKNREGEGKSPPTFASLGDEYKKLGAWAEEFAGDCAWALQVNRWGLSGHPVAWIKTAMEQCAASGRLTITYVNGTLLGYQRENGPPKPVGKFKPNGVAKPPEPIVDSKKAADAMAACQAAAEKSRIEGLARKGKTP